MKKNLQDKYNQQISIAFVSWQSLTKFLPKIL